jgi:hypothetical protein
MTEPTNYQIDSITFTEGLVSIAFIARDEANKRVMLAKQVTFNPAVCPELVEDIQKLAADLIDEALTDLSAPPDRISPPRGRTTDG